MKAVVFIIVLVCTLGLWYWGVYTARQTPGPGAQTGGKTPVNDLPGNPTLPKQTGLTKAPESKPGGEKLKVLEEILTSKNDNDPRLDKDFNHLTDAEKVLLREKYSSLPPERRNEKGTIVFLLGRNLGSAEDFNFLESVLKEAPCYSLADCTKSEAARGDSAHDDMGSQVTLAYPQVVTLKAIEKYLNSEAQKKGGAVALAVRVLETGKTSPTRIVSTMADKLLKESAHNH